MRVMREQGVGDAGELEFGDGGGEIGTRLGNAGSGEDVGRDEFHFEMAHAGTGDETGGGECKSEAGEVEGSEDGIRGTN